MPIRFSKPATSSRSPTASSPTRASSTPSATSACGIPDNPNRYLLSRSRAPELVTAEDFIEYDIEFAAAARSRRRAIFRAGDPRRNLQGAAGRECRCAIIIARPSCRCLPPAPTTCRFSISARSAASSPPFWDQHDEFGDTNMLVVKPEEGASLARALGQALDGADDAARRHRRRHQRARLRFPLGLFGAQCRVSGARA